MSEEQKLQQLENWLVKHNAKEIRDIVFDGNATITKIDRGQYDYSITLMPNEISHNIGGGYGRELKIIF